MEEYPDSDFDRDMQLTVGGVYWRAVQLPHVARIIADRDRMKREIARLTERLEIARLTKKVTR